MEAEGSDKVQLTPDRLLTGHKTRVHAHTRVWVCACESVCECVCVRVCVYNQPEEKSESEHKRQQEVCQTKQENNTSNLNPEKNKRLKKEERGCYIGVLFTLTLVSLCPFQGLFDHG